MYMYTVQRCSHLFRTTSRLAVNNPPPRPSEKRKPSRVQLVLPESQDHILVLAVSYVPLCSKAVAKLRP